MHFIVIRKLLHIESRVRVKSIEEVLVSWRRVLQTALADWLCKHKNLGRVLNCTELVLTSLIITMLLCFLVWCHKLYSSLLPNKPQRFFRVCQWWNSLKGVCTFLSFPLRFHSFRLRENASGWSAPKVDSPVLNWRTDPWHQPWCTLHVWISCPSDSTNEFGRNLGDAQIGDMEVSTLPLLFTSKEAPSLGTSTGKVTFLPPTSVWPLPICPATRGSQRERSRRLACWDGSLPAALQTLRALCVAVLQPGGSRWRRCGTTN